MKELITFIKEFEGIIGAVLGVIATLITTQLTKNFGKLYFYFYDFKINYYGKDEDGIYGYIDNINKADSCGYKVRIQLYNSSDVIKILRDIEIEFVLENRSIINKPHNTDEEEKRQHYTISKNLNLININPKKMIEINIDGYISKENMAEISKVKKIYFKAKNHKNRQVKKLIKKF